MDKFITKEGLERYELFNKYGLGEFWEMGMGNIIIFENEITPEIQNKVFKLLSDFPFELVMGFEGEDEEKYLFVTGREDLNI